MKDIKDFDRISLGQLPTPLHKLENISKLLNTNVWIKRDDLIGVGLGGNKVRKLEFLLAEAKKEGAEVVFTTGGAQSNHAMLTAACALRLGMTPILLLKNEGVTDRLGNQLLNHLMGVEVHFLDVESFDEIYDEMNKMGKALGKKYYKIPCGGSNALGSIGYVNCMKEIAEQEKALGIKFDHVICTEGSGGTHAGVNLGSKLFLPEAKVTAMTVDDSPFDEITTEIERGAIKLLDLDIDLGKEELTHIDCTGPGYALPSEEGNEAIKIMCQNEGIFLDPVYTGKAFGGLLKMSREGQFKETDNVLFVFSGGAGGLFAIDMD